ncbi:MAG: SDR family oxidoreductase [Pseudomonadota bacterium]
MTSTNDVEFPTSSAATTANEQREIQRRQDDADQSKPSSDASGDAPLVQTGLRDYPTELPAQHLTKPGLESDLALKPQFMAPDYEGSNKLRDQVAIITGGDSGIGRAVAVLFAREGADVAIVYLTSHSDAEDTKRFVEAEGGRCVLVAGDVRDPEFCEQAVQQTLQELGRVDILVNNAAFQEHADSLLDLTEDRFDQTFRTNVYGYFHMAKAVLPHLKKGACIINTGSVTGLEGSPHLLDYSATKGAIHAFTKALAQNVLERGIRVNAVAPGPVWTPLNPADSPAEKVANFGQKTDMRRAAQPEEISPAYVFLASAICSSYITGVVLPITGSVGAV